MTKKKKRVLYSVVLLGAISMAASWWIASHGNTPGHIEPATAKVIRRDFSSSVLATGAVKPQVGAEVKVGARISGKVVRLHANIGDPIERGQVIAELEKQDLQAVVAKNRAEVSVAEAKITEVRARLRLAQVQYERQKRLIADDLTSRQAVDDALKERDVELAELHLSQRQLEAAQAILEESQAKLSYATLTAPISGVIASVSTQEGETVAAGLNAPVFVNIIDLNRLQVDAFVDEVDIGKVRPGQKAIFSVDSFPSREFEGRVAAIYPKAVLQENVVYYDVVIDITTPYEGLLRPEMTASVTILMEARTAVLAVPAEAVKRVRGKTLVYVLVNGRPEPREVKTGWKDGQWIEVAGGLEERQTVLLNGPQAMNHQSGS